MRNTGRLRRSTKKVVVIGQHKDLVESKVFSCSFKQTIPNEVWASGFHRNRKHLSKVTLQYFLDNNFCCVEDIIFYLLESKSTSDFALFGLLMKWGRQK